jgi:UDP-glucose 4-epimerase
VKVLVTGGAGYIGSITTRMLLDAGHEVVVLDTLENGHRAAVDPRARFEKGDVGDQAVLDRLMPGVDSVMHLAGYIEVAESQRDPGRYFRNNACKPLIMLEGMARHGVGAIVFSSTAAVYGEPAGVPIDEAAPTVPVNAYGASKLMFEEALEWFGASHAVRSVRLRYFNVAGAWPDGSAGEDHRPETHIIPRVLRSMADGERTFEVYGQDYPTPDGTCVRDYIHVCDLGSAHVRALERAHAGAAAASGAASEVFNLGNGCGYSNLEVVRTCAEVTGIDVEVRFGPRRAGDPAALVASNERAGAVLGWRPERGDLRTIVEDAWRWHSARPGGWSGGD